MKLLEILGKPEKSKETLGDYQSRLRDLRMKQVGSGVQAHVYQHPKANTIVVKVSREEEAPLVYLKYVLKNQNNPYVPKVYNVRRFQQKEDRRYFPRSHTEQYYVAFIEKLTEYKWLSDKQKQLILQKHLGPDIVAWLGEPNRYNSEAFSYMADTEGVQLMRASNKKLGVPSKHLIDVMSFLANRGNPETLDLHEGNIMMRGDHPVITDPVV